MPRIIEFEGRRIQVPDDTTDDEIVGILSQPSTSEPPRSGVRATFGGPDPSAPKTARPFDGQTPDDRSLIDTIMGYGAAAGSFIDQGGRGIAEGAMNIAGLPADLINIAPMAANLIPGVDGVGPISRDGLYLGSKHLKDSANNINDYIAGQLGVEAPDQTPDNMAERAIHRIGEEVGAAAVPAAGIMARAERVGVDAARNGNWLSRTFVEPAAVDPARFVGKEAMVATGAGMGGATANEFVDRNTTAGQWADFGGSLAGAASVGLSGSVAGNLSELVQAIFSRSNYVDDVVKEAVVDRLAQAGGLQKEIGGKIDTNELVDTIMNGPRIGDTVPGVTESLADRTANPGIAALEYSRQTGPNSGMFAQRRAENAKAIDSAVSANEPQGSPGAFSSELSLERDRQLMDAGVLARNAQEDADRAVAPLQPQGTPAARGNTVRTGLEDARETARDNTEAAYAAADVANVPADPVQLAATLDRVTDGLSQAERGLVPQGLIDRVAGLGRVAEGAEPPGPITLREATDLRSELQRLERAALADPRAERGGRNAARVINRYVQATDDFIERSLPADQMEALRTARGTKFDEAERFTRQGDPVASALARNEGGMPRMRDERVAGTFTNPQNMDRLFAQADTPEVRAAIRNEMLSNADLGSAEGIQRFTQENAEALQRFPGLQQELEAAARARGTEAAATGTEQELTRRLTQQGRSNVANYLSYGDENADRAMQSVLSARDPSAAVDELLTFVNDQPQAVEGARKVFWDLMAKHSKRAGETTAGADGAQPWMPRRLQRFLDDPRNAAVASRLYRDEPEHLENLKKIVGAIQGLDVRNSGKAPNTSGTAQGILPTTETLGSRFFAYQRGQVGAGWLVTSLAAMMGRRAVKGARADAIERMLDQALLNPDAAAMLLKENNPANRAALARKAKLWGVNEASTVINALSGEEPDDVKDAINR